MMLKEVETGKYFRVANGVVIRSVWELEPAFEVMGEETFTCHVNSEKNDFARWAADVLNDNELANRLLAIKDKQEMRIAVLRRIIEVLRGEGRG